MSPPVGADAVDRLAADEDLAAVGLEQSGEHVEGGRLAGPRGTEQGDELSLLDVEVERIERRDLAEPLRDTAEANELMGSTLDPAARHAAIRK